MAKKQSPPARAPGAEREIVTTTFRIFRDQRDALQQAAFKLRDREGGRGKADASAVLREVLDQAGMKG